MNELISVIVPIYNVDQYLDTCIDSIVNQTYQNLEIILINDGSTDQCGKICDEWAAKDSRIQVFHQKNKGLSGARNSGLDIAHGNYIGFVDSDDYIHPQMYELLYHAAKDYDADISVCREQIFFESVKESGTCSAYDIEEINDKEMLFSHFLNIGTGRPFWVWNKLYKKTVIGCSKFFVEKKCAEDILFNADVYPNSTRAVWIKQRLYYYRQRAGSIMNSHDPTMFLVHAEAMEYVNARIKELGFDILSQRCIPFYLNQIAHSEERAYIWRAKDIQKQLREKYVEEYKKYRRDLIEPRDKLKFFFIQNMNFIYHHLKKKSVKKSMGEIR